MDPNTLAFLTGVQTGLTSLLSPWLIAGLFLLTFLRFGSHA